MLISLTKYILRFSQRRSFCIKSEMSAEGEVYCKVAVCQMTATNDKARNFQIVKKLLREASQCQVKVAFLPEACDFIATDSTEARSLAETLEGPLVSSYIELAKSYDLWLSIGGFHERSDEKMYNSHILINNSGDIVSVYRKIHLFDVTIPEKNIFLKESDLNTSGSQIHVPIDTPVGKLALSTCYDLRFPEQSTLQTKLGAEILSYPSAFTKATGEAHWEALLRARAIENQCYVVAAAQYGKHNSARSSFGHSMIVDPWGKILAQCGKYTGQNENEVDESVAVAPINKEYLVKIRQEMPVFQHRRNDLYGLSLVQSEAKGISDTDTFNFAHITISGDVVFYRSQYSYAFTNIRCVVPGHVLVSTIRVARRLADLMPVEIADLFQTVVKVQRAVEQEYKADSSTVTIQDGPSSGQTIPHVHVHVMPRKAKDFEKNDDIYLHLANHEKNVAIRPKEEMIGETRRLRKYFN